MEESEEEEDIGEEVLRIQMEKLNKEAEAAFPVGTFDPGLNGFWQGTDEKEALSSEGVPADKRGRFVRPSIAVGIWAELETAGLKEPAYMTDGKQVSYVKSSDYRMYLLTNRTIKIQDTKKETHVYTPLENVKFFTVKLDGAAERRLKA